MLYTNTNVDLFQLEIGSFITLMDGIPTPCTLKIILFGYLQESNKKNVFQKLKLSRSLNSITLGYAVTNICCHLHLKKNRERKNVLK